MDLAVFVRRAQRQYRGWVVVAILLALGLPAWLHESDHQARVTFFDVGQGDAAHIRAAAGIDVVIDGGPTDRFATQLAADLPATDRTIELLVLTHPHADHLTGLLSVLDRFHVQRVLVTDATSTSSIFTRWQAALAVESATVTTVHAGDTFALPNGHLTVLWPTGSTPGLNLNDSSIVLRVDVGASCVLFMGDASSEVEQQLLPSLVACQVLKVGHHGSTTATSDPFLAAVQPTAVVISVGLHNRYGHPAPSTVHRLQQRVRQLFRTDCNGTVTLMLDLNAVPPDSGPGGLRWHTLKKCPAPNPS